MANAITPGTTISARFITDSECIVTAKVIARKNDMVTLTIQGETIRKKVKRNHLGEEYVLAMGTYSMAPIFMAR